MQKPPLTSGLLVIFGITGDLARRYLLPALYHLQSDNLLPEHFELIGVTRRGTTVDKLLENIKAEVEKRDGNYDADVLKKLGERLRVVTMDITLASDYKELKSTLDKIEDERGTCLNRLFYLSIPPQAFGPVVDLLGESGLNNGCQHGVSDSRMMVEKPFGYDLESAKGLIERLTKSFSEDQIFRIDHYLAKETAQNIITFRFSNPVFVADWNNKSVTRIVISAKELIGIEGRVAFYESTGALRDFVQNHLMQLLSIVAMDEPAEAGSAEIHAEKLKLMKSIKTIQPNEVTSKTVRGQYKDYRDEVTNQDSTTETFAHIELEIDNDRWRGVPVVLQSGKHLDEKRTDVTLTFGNHKPDENVLVFRLQPNEGITLEVQAKKPGFDNQTERVEMAFNYPGGAAIHPDAYERVLMDGIRGDQSLFASSDEVLESWRIVDSVVHEWSKNGDGLVIYEPGVTPKVIIASDKS